MKIDNSEVKIEDKELRILQLIQLEMLLEVDRICKKNGIKYSIIAGTTLGAVRHKGFIPWDDDADVAMLRKDYEKFIELVDSEIDTDRFEFQESRKTTGYRWGYGKLRRKETEFLRSGQNHLGYFQGIFIDIFPLDYVPDNSLLRGFHNLLCFSVRKLQWSYVGCNIDRNPLKRVGYKLLNIIPLKVINKLYFNLAKISNLRKSKLVRILTFPTPKGRCYGYKTEWYEKLTPLEFEGYLFPAAAKYKQYLHFKFGDYTKLPKKCDRKGHKVSSYKLIELKNINVSDNLKF